jgi:glycosyltransferase involved in cell wall biosynthesis
MTMRVLHVVATGQRRGAEMFASDLVRTLDGFGGYEQRVAFLHGPWPPDVAYAAPVARLRGRGRRIPGLRMDAATLGGLRSAIRRVRPQVVHAHGGEAFKYCALATSGTASRLVYRRIGTAPASITRGPRRVAHAALLRRADRIVAVAGTVRRETIETFGIPGERVVTIPRGIDPARIRPGRDRDAVRTELGLATGTPVVVTVGALSPEKDPIAHLELCGVLRRSLPDVAYLFVGDGPMRTELEDAVRARGLDGSVRLLGLRSDVGDLLAAGDVHVLASRTEGMPGCLIEAGMAGMPVVAFGLAGVPEVVEDAVTGFVVEPGDHASLAERVLKLLADEELRREMGRAAARRCLATFDIAGIARRYAEVYAEVAA